MQRRKLFLLRSFSLCYDVCMTKKRNFIFTQFPDDYTQETGTESPFTQQMLMRQAMNLSTDGIGGTADGIEPDFEMTRALMEGIGPQDALEGMLAAQMVAVHNKCMSFLHDAQYTQPGSENEDYKLKQSMKLMSTFARQMDTLRNYRRKGEQKITVERVDVQSGGQAIVGNVSTGDGKPKRKSSATAIENKSGEEVFMPEMKTVKQRTKSPNPKDE